MKNGAIRATTGGFLIALLFASSNLLGNIQLVPGVPFTLQIFVVALMGLILGLKGGLLCLSALYLLTAVGFPMMAGGNGGLGVLVGPTGGFIVGFVFVAVLLGLYRDRYANLVMSKKVFGVSLHTPLVFLLGIIGLLLDYLLGSLWLSVFGGNGISAWSAVLLPCLTFLPADLIKICLAAVVSLFLFKKSRYIAP